jgi:uncharacterized membrane protein YhhN
MRATWLATAAVAAFLSVHLVAEARGARVARAIGKMGASGAFVALALALGVEGAFERGLLAGLVLSLVGDALLLSAGRRAFLGGLAAFLLAHVAYAGAFAGVSSPSGWVGLAVLVPSVAVLRRLWPRLGDMHAPVAAYCLVISVMLWLALGVDRPEIRLGAAAFYLSDLLVARDRFVHASIANRLAGLPLYYGAQLLLASAVG